MFKQKSISRLPNQRDGVSLLPSVDTSGVALDIAPIQVHRARLRLSGVALAVAEADDYGSVKLLDLPDSNLLLLAVEANLELVKGEETGGLEADTDLDVAIGTAAASASTLSAGMIDVIEKVDLNDSDASPAFQAHSAGQSTATHPQEILDGASNSLYLNVAAAITADDSLTVSGTVDVFYIDLGNEIS